MKQLDFTLEEKYRNRSLAVNKKQCLIYRLYLIEKQYNIQANMNTLSCHFKKRKIAYPVIVRLFDNKSINVRLATHRICHTSW